MKLINDNPYRIAGLLANSSAKELQKQKSKITKYASIGKQVDSELDFPFFGNIDRSESSITKAFSRIEQNQDKVSHSLFWFLKANTFDETAINYLINDDKTKAIEIWEKVTNGKDVTSKNFSCFNNIGTLKLLGRTKDEIKEGLEAKIKLIESPIFEDFVHTVADQTYAIDNQRQEEKFVDDILKQIKGRFSVPSTLKLFSNCNRNTQKYLIQKFTEEPIDKIESQIETCKKKRKENKGSAYEFGLKLHTNTKNDLKLLKSMLGKSELKYKALADQLANEVLQCGIDYFNESQENMSSDNYLESSQKLTEIAGSIAVGKIAKDRVKDSLASLEEMKDSELSLAISALKSIKAAYEEACRQIDKQVNDLQYETYGGIEGRPPMRFPKLNVSIDWDKVEEMKQNCLDWNKVTEVIREAIPQQNLEKIKSTSNTNKLKEYKLLVNFLLGKISYSYKNKVAYINYWDTPKTAITSRTSTTTVKPISGSSSTGGCYIATMAYGDYDHPQVLELRTFRDEFLSKSYLGSNFIKMYYRYSPLLVEKLKDKTQINGIIRTFLDNFIKIIKK